MKIRTFITIISTTLFTIILGCNGHGKIKEKLIGKWEYQYTVLGSIPSSSYLLIKDNGDNFSITEWVEFGNDNGKHTNEETKICSFKDGCFSDQMGCYDEKTGTLRKIWHSSSNPTVEYKKLPY